MLERKIPEPVGWLLERRARPGRIVPASRRWVGTGLLPQGAVILAIAYAVLTPVAWAVSAGLGFLGPLLLVIAEAWVAWAVWGQLSPEKARSRVR